MDAIKIEKKQKIISLPADVINHLGEIAKENKISLKRYIENIVLDKGRESMLRHSSEVMLDAYASDKDLTVFSELDNDEFYETE